MEKKMESQIDTIAPSSVSSLEINISRIQVSGLYHTTEEATTSTIIIGPLASLT